MKPFFLSHSSQDKNLVRTVATILGPERCWFDEWELVGGDELFSNLDSAIESSATKVFVIFWSKPAKSSAWVNEELANARVRRLRRGDIRIIPVRLDETDMPLWMSRLVHLDASNGAENIAKSLELEARTGLVNESSRVIDNTFQDRVPEADIIENSYYSPECAGVVLAGFPGIGKSALCRYVLQNRLPHLRAIWVDFEASTSPAYFFAALADRASVRLPSSVLNSGNWSSYWRAWLLPALDPVTDVIVLDGMNFLLDENAVIPAWLEEVLVDWCIKAGENCLPLMVLTSRMVDLPLKLARRVTEIQLSRLREEDVVRALRIRLANSYPRRHPTQAQLETAATIVSGYPLGVQLWSAYATRVGIDLALLDPAPVQRQVQALVGDILSKCRLSDREQRALSLLSVAKIPLDLSDLADLGVRAEDLQSLHRSMLLNPGTNHGFSVHGLVADYLINHISSHQAVRKVHDELGALFLRRWRESPSDFAISTTLASQAYFHLLAAGKFSEASTVVWSLLEEARSAVYELYRMRQYESVVQVARSIFEMGRSDDQVEFYYALCLARNNASPEDAAKAVEVFSNLTQRSPRNGYYWVGFGDALSRIGRTTQAKDVYMKARALRQDDAVPSLRLGELLLREGDLINAAPFLSEAYSRNPGDSRVLAGYASLLQRQGNQADALKIVSDGLRRRPDDIHLNHRAGLILKDMGKTMEALTHLTRAAKGESSPASYISLADLYLEMGRIKDAKAVLARHPEQKTAAFFNIEGNIARREERFTDAEECFLRCKRMEGDGVVLFGSFSSLRIAQAEKAIEMMAFQVAKAYVIEAEEFVRKGLALDGGNEVLLWLKKDIDRVRLLALKGESI